LVTISNNRFGYYKFKRNSISIANYHKFIDDANVKPVLSIRIWLYSLFHLPLQLFH
jgi:hypothetical protein